MKIYSKQSETCAISLPQAIATAFSDLSDKILIEPNKHTISCAFKISQIWVDMMYFRDLLLYIVDTKILVSQRDSSQNLPKPDLLNRVAG